LSIDALIAKTYSPINLCDGAQIAIFGNYFA